MHSSCRSNLASFLGVFSDESFVLLDGFRLRPRIVRLFWCLGFGVVLLLGVEGFGVWAWACALI